MPKTLKSGERMMVLKVKNFCEREKRNNALLVPLRCVQARVAAITGVSEKTVSKITKEGDVAASTSTKVSTPCKSGPRPKKIELDDFERCAIRHKIHEFYSVKKELPTLTKLLHEMRSEIGFKGSRTTLWRIMKDIGFYFKKCRSKRKVLMERYDIVAWRLEELRNNRPMKIDGPVIDSEMERFIIEVGDDRDTSDDEDDVEDELDDDLSGISPLDEHFLVDHNYNKNY